MLTGAQALLLGWIYSNVYTALSQHWVSLPDVLPLRQEGLCDVFGCWYRNDIEMVRLELRQPSKKKDWKFSSVRLVGSRPSVEGRYSVHNVELCFCLMLKFCVLQDDIQLFNSNCQIKGKMLATWIFHNLFQSGFYIWSQCWLSFQQSPNVNYFLTVSSSWSLLSLQMSYSNTLNCI